MASVSHLLTFVDLMDHDPGPDFREMHGSARPDAVLDDGRRSVLLDGRGWSGRSPAGSVWALQTVESMEETARPVVGPDGASDSVTQDEMDADHRGSPAEDLSASGVEISGAELAALRHDVELSERVLARIGRGR